VELKKMLLRANEGKEACHKARKNEDQLKDTQKQILKWRKELGMTTED
jgi:hypothetical protein